MARQSLSFPISLMLFLVCGLLIYWVVSSRGWPAVEISVVWLHMPRLWRAFVVGMFMGNAYGLGSMLNAVLTRGRTS